MKNASKKKMIWLCMGVLIAVLSASVAFADFYVIGTKRAKKVILVSPKSTQSASGTALLDAMDSITDASSTNPYMLLIEPGIYDIGAISLDMQDYVDIQGAGEGVTIIKGSMNSSSNGVLRGSDNAEVRFLTVKHIGGGTHAVGISNTSNSPSITHVTIEVSGAGYHWGVKNLSSASPVMQYVNIRVTGATGNSCGVRNYDTCDPIMSNVRIYVSGDDDNTGIYNYNNSVPEIACSHIVATGGSGDNIGLENDNLSGTKTIRIDRSFIRGSNYAILTNSGETTYIGGSRLSGTGTVTGAGTNRCVGTYSQNYIMLNTDCSVP